MKSLRIFSAFAALAAAAAFTPAQAHIVTYSAVLTGATENPAVVTPGTGTATVIVDDHNFTLQLITTFAGLIGNTTAAHIHCCTLAAFAGNAGVATTLPSFTGFPLGVTSGSYNQLFDMTQASSWNPAYVNANGGNTSTAFSALISGIDGGKAYLNIHTSFVGSGEIRGLLQAVPEPGTVALTLAALALAATATARRKTV